VIPEVECDRETRASLEMLAAGPEALSRLECELAIDGRFSSRLGGPSLRRAVNVAFGSHDHVVLRGMPTVSDGVALLAALSLVSSTPKFYRGDRVVKHFRMSPWTSALSHTAAEGHFHTDLNTSVEPPAVTGIMCLDPDPGAPRYGEVRVCRVRSLLAEASRRRWDDVLRFLTDTEVSMVNDTSSTEWTGRIIVGESIRFHPETLRASERRRRVAPQHEPVLARIKELALATSEPIHLDRGDVLLVSNRRCLHYRGACSVRFTRFPTEFDARRVAVAHAMDESCDA